MACGYRMVLHIAGLQGEAPGFFNFFNPMADPCFS